jgi:hypothetical protein
MTNPQPVKAYSVQADECGEVVFAKHGAGARRRGAAMMDLEWTDIVSCRRAPQFDCFAPGPLDLPANADIMAHNNRRPAWVR